MPPFHLGGQDMYAVSPDGEELAYTSNIDEVEATSTNNEIFIVPITTAGEGERPREPKKISTSPGSDNTPLYSPDGKYIAWRSQARNCFEADKQSLLLYERTSGKVRDLTEKFDRSIGSFTWWWPSRNPDAELPPTVVFAAEDAGEGPVWIGLESPKGPSWLAEHVHADDLTPGGDAVFFTSSSIAAPNEIWRVPREGHDQLNEPERLTHMNDSLLSQIDMHLLESFAFKGANDEEVQGFIIKPPGFDPAKEYPLKFLIHGGPQGAWGNSWSYRWNPRTIRREWLFRGDDQSARLDRLRADVH